MSWTDQEIAWVQAIQEQLNNQSTAISNLMTKQQMRQLVLLRQREIEALTQRITTLEAAIVALQNNLS